MLGGLRMAKEIEIVTEITKVSNANDTYKIVMSSMGTLEEIERIQSYLLKINKDHKNEQRQDEVK